MEGTDLGSTGVRGWGGEETSEDWNVYGLGTFDKVPG